LIGFQAALSPEEAGTRETIGCSFDFCDHPHSLAITTRLMGDLGVRDEKKASTYQELIKVACILLWHRRQYRAYFL
jgi:hypothetical protein